MTIKGVRERGEIPEKYRWNAESVFADAQAWQQEFKRLEDELTTVSSFEGTLFQGPHQLLKALRAVDELSQRVRILFVYAGMAHNVDTTDQEAAGMQNQVQGLGGRFKAALAFLDPELIQLGQDTLQKWMDGESELAYLAHYVDDLFRKQAHIRSTEVEQIMGMLADPFSGTAGTYALLTNADFDFPPAAAEDGSEHALTHSLFRKYMNEADRELRKTTWEHYLDTFAAHKQSLTSNLITSIKQDVFQMRIRKHTSTLNASLFEDNIPEQVFYNLIDTFRRNLPTWHRYWRIRRQILEVDELHPYDIWAPLTRDQPAITFEAAVELICAGLKPMGSEYVETVRRGCFEQRWVDAMPCKGKRAGAFSSGTKGSFPFINMSFNDSALSLSTLAHELGHSMHSYLTWENQPELYSHYSLFVAEVASNFHQALVRKHLLETSEPAFRIAVIEEAMSNFHRYFFIMPTLARFELELHQRVERGEGLTADHLIGLMADLFAEGYGGEVIFDKQRVGMLWAMFGHLYRDYYVFQYATGISGAHAMAKGIMDGRENAVENYLSFLKAGSSVYPLQALQMGGVDLTQPEPVEAAFEVLARMVSELEALLL